MYWSQTNMDFSGGVGCQGAFRSKFEWMHIMGLWTTSVWSFLGHFPNKLACGLHGFSVYSLALQGHRSTMIRGYATLERRNNIHIQINAPMLIENAMKLCSYNLIWFSMITRRLWWLMLAKSLTLYLCYSSTIPHKRKWRIIQAIIL